MSNDYECDHHECEDIDMHRYQCLMCGEVMYYNSQAREYWESGTTSNVMGLRGDDEYLAWLPPDEGGRR